MEAAQTMTIATDSCNGEEIAFENWMNENYPEIDTSIENTLDGGLFETDEETGMRTRIEHENYWDRYCSA